jgi:hypothetical protein
LPTKPRRADQDTAFISAAAPLRRLAIANFSTKLARLNAIMEAANGNTHVKTLESWRDKGFEADFIQDLTRGKGEPKAQTAMELITFLCDGSPASRAIFQELLTVKATEKLDKKKYKHHQKLMVTEKIPANALFAQILLRCALVDARVMHAGLSNKAKAKLCQEFNDPNSTIKVLFIMYDVGAQGLNMQPACDRVLFATIANNRSQEAQGGGRVNRVSNLDPKSTFEFSNSVLGDFRVFYNYRQTHHS